MSARTAGIPIACSPSGAGTMESIELRTSKDFRWQHVKLQQKREANYGTRPTAPKATLRTREDSMTAQDNVQSPKTASRPGTRTTVEAFINRLDRGRSGSLR